VHSPVEDCPADFSGILALEEKRFGFGGVETEDFAVAADEKATAARVDFTG
jgi:hypothetical protein